MGFRGLRVCLSFQLPREMGLDEVLVLVSGGFRRDQENISSSLQVSQKIRDISPKRPYTQQHAWKTLKRFVCFTD